MRFAAQSLKKSPKVNISLQTKVAKAPSIGPSFCRSDVACFRHKERMVTIRVLLADDHAIVRDGLQEILDKRTDILVVGHASDGYQTVELAKQLNPDVIFMDLAMPRLNGIDALRRIRKSRSKTKVVILSMHLTAEHLSQALNAGAAGYITKESAAREALKAVYAVQAGHRYFGQRVLEEHRELTFSGVAPETRTPLQQLTRRENEVLHLVAMGYSSTEAAEVLHLSPKTVQSYRRHSGNSSSRPGLDNL